MLSLLRAPSPIPPASQGPTSSHPMASVVTPPRQLAPTVGPAAALAGVKTRTGIKMVSSGERAVSGLVQCYGRIFFVANNAESFGREPFPFNGGIVQFGDHEIYIAAVKHHVYPRVV